MAAAGLPTTGGWATWLDTWACLTMPGPCVAVLAWGPARALGIAATVAIPVAVVSVTVAHGCRQWDASSRRRTLGMLARVSSFAAAFVVTIALVGASNPGFAALIVVIAVLSTPSAVDVGRQLFRRPSTRTDTHAAPPEATAGRDGRRGPEDPSETIHHMSDDELRIAWRYTFWALRETDDPTRKLTMVRMRECFLDELESRDAAGLHAWLASGARPSTLPPPPLRGGDDDRPTRG